MLSNVIVWFAIAKDKRGLKVVGAVLLLVALGVIAWNLLP